VRLPGRRSGSRRAARPAGSARPPGERPAGNRAGRSGGAHPARHLRPAGRAWPSIRLPRPTRLPRFTPARAGALLGIIGSLGGIYGLAATTAFTYARAEIPELRWTSPEAVEAAVGIPAGANLFRITVAPIEDRIATLPGVARARVTVALPDTLVVEITEREAIVAWAVGEQRFLVDVDGVLFAASDPGGVAIAGLPVIDDARAEAATYAIGDRLDPVTLDAARRLGSLVPDDIGSVADTLLVTVSDATGFVVGTSPGSWIAIFGLYTPTQRTPEMIPAQVRLLRSLLADRGEATVEQVILADGENGTVVARPTAAP
jgi:hypothetical protein